VPETTVPAAGQIGWIDLTVPDAERVRAFYEHVTVWTAAPVSMGDYNDYCMIPAGGDKPVAGVCHASGDNKSMPPSWLIYITVAHLDESVRRCAERGGEAPVAERRIAGMGRFCVIEDPAGALAALYQPK
jgi:predicted enzyme related to lactoylglutathione lyase